MIKNYLKIIYRSFIKYKAYSFINIVGLAAGISCFFLILLFIKNELSYDSFQKNKNLIYRFAEDLKIRGDIVRFSTASAPEGNALKNDFPEIENVVRFFEPSILGVPIITFKDKHFSEPDFLYTDPDVFKVFTFTFLQGNPNTALNNINSIVLTKSSAIKYFGNEDPVNKILFLDDTLGLKVTAVIDDLPENTHLIFSMLASMSTIGALIPGILETTWNSNLFHTYLKLKKGASIKSIKERLPEFKKKYIGDKYFQRDYELEPLTDIHLYSNRYASLKPNGSIEYIYIFSSIALFILVIACINFMNLSTARSSIRSKEIGMRQVFGADRKKLIYQFLSESLITSLLSFLLSIFLIETALPFFNSAAGKDIQFSIGGNLSLYLILLLIAIISGLAAGLYPAFYLSSLTPYNNIKKNNRDKSIWIRKGLVIFQFAISIGLTICTIVVFSQLNYFRNKNLGFNKDHIFFFPVGNLEANSKIKTLENSLRENPDISDVSVSFGVPGKGMVGVDYWLEGTKLQEVNNVITLFVDENFIPTYEIKLKEGRGFSEKIKADKKEGFIINETAAKKFGWENPIGKRINYIQQGKNGYETLKKGRVIGVIKDINYSSLSLPIQPLILQEWEDWGALNMVSVKISSRHLPNTISYIENKFKEYNPSRPFEYSFIDENFNSLYQSEEKLSSMFSFFSILAIIIAYLGLLGLSSFSIERRIKEIGIRKVLGASISGITFMLIKEFTKLVLIANLIAWPAAYIVMNNWLKDFAFRININLWILISSGIIALLIALLTVGFHAVKAAAANPVKSLRYE